MIVIVDFGMGNLRSVEKAMQRLNAQTIISSDVTEIERADKLILPGVGHFGKGMEKLLALDLIDILNKKVLHEKVPILGVCLGMQLFVKHSDEGNANGLGWIDADVVKFNYNGTKNPSLIRYKIPHMGWNNLKFNKKSFIMNKISNQDSFYFVHSYHVICHKPENILATTNYSFEFVSSIQKENIIGVQFHPEKSHLSGLCLLGNFINL